MNQPPPKPVRWAATSKKDLRNFPREVQAVIGRALLVAQFGFKAENAKPLKGLGGAGVLEIVEDHDGSTYRAVYTVKFQDAVYVLHVFQKKSKRGIATPKRELDLIRSRLKDAEADYRIRQGES